MINIKEILEKYNIKYYTEGKNVQKGWINIQCPFCNDKSNHGGFNLETKKLYYNCWHCGHRFPDEIFKQLRIPLLELKNIKKIQEDIKIKLSNKITFKLPGKELDPKAIQYLKDRNFNPEEITEKYKILSCNHLDPNYKFRIIIPIIYENQIISFTSRDYTNKQKLRYISCPENMEKINHKTILYNLDNCRNNTIIVVEGIFDCWRLGNNCCATFGINYTKQQLNILSGYDNIFIIFDSEEDAQKQAKELGNILSAIGKNTVLIHLPEKYKDVAELNKKEALTLKKELGL